MSTASIEHMQLGAEPTTNQDGDPQVPSLTTKVTTVSGSMLQYISPHGRETQIQIHLALFRALSSERGHAITLHNEASKAIQ